MAIITKPPPAESAATTPATGERSSLTLEQRRERDTQVHDMMLLSGGMVQVLEELMTYRGLALTDRKALVSHTTEPQPQPQR